MADSGILKLALKLSVIGCHYSVDLQSKKKIEVLSEDAIETQCSVIRAKKQLVFIGPYTLFYFPTHFLLYKAQLSRERGGKETHNLLTSVCVQSLCMHYYATWTYYKLTNNI